MKYTKEEIMHAIHDEVEYLERKGEMLDTSIAEVVRKALKRLDTRPVRFVNKEK